MGEAASRITVCSACGNLCVDDVWYTDVSIDELLEHRLANVIVEATCPNCSDEDVPAPA